MHYPQDGAAAQVSAAVRAACPDWRVVRAWPLWTGLSARVTGIEVSAPGETVRSLVLREYGAADLRADTEAGVTEYRLLRFLREAGLPVPRPYHAEAHWLLVEFIDGVRVDEPPDVAAFIDAMARTLAAVHCPGCEHADVPALAHVTDGWGLPEVTQASVADEALSETDIRAALTARWPPASVNEPVVLHGDYWPGNTLWREDRLVGVIDWEDAMVGDPLADVAVARQEIQWFFGAAAMSDFTARYLALRPRVDVTALPLWDLRAALRPAGKLAGWGLSAGRRAGMIAAHRQFVSAALGQLTDSGRQP